MPTLTPVTDDDPRSCPVRVGGAEIVSVPTLTPVTDDDPRNWPLGVVGEEIVSGLMVPPPFACEPGLAELVGFSVVVDALMSSALVGAVCVNVPMELLKLTACNVAAIVLLGVVLVK